MILNFRYDKRWFEYSLGLFSSRDFVDICFLLTKESFVMDRQTELRKEQTFLNFRSILIFLMLELSSIFAFCSRIHLLPKPFLILWIFLTPVLKIESEAGIWFLNGPFVDAVYCLGRCARWSFWEVVSFKL